MIQGLMPNHLRFGYPPNLPPIGYAPQPVPTFRPLNEEPEESETTAKEPEAEEPETETFMSDSIALADQLEAAAKEIRKAHLQKLASEMSFDPETLRDFEWTISVYNYSPPEYQIRLAARGDKSKLLLEQCQAAGDWLQLKEYLDMDSEINNLYLSHLGTLYTLCWLGNIGELDSLLGYVGPIKVTNLKAIKDNFCEQRDQQKQELAAIDSCLERLREQEAV